MKEKKRLLTFVLFCLFALLSGTLQAQVVIGDDVSPMNFSILEIFSNGKGGLRMPYLTTIERDAITTHPDFTGKKAELGRGLTIYNTDINCVEYWNGTKWISQCDGSVPEPCLEPCDCDGDGFLSQDCGGNDPDDDDPCNPAVKPLAFTAAPSGNVVVGTPVTITVTTTGTYAVNNVSIDGGKTRIKGNKITVTPGKVGTNTYTIMVNNCPTQTVTVNITATACEPITSVAVTTCVPYMFTYQTMTLKLLPQESGSPATGYQWYLDGVAVEGATDDTFTFSPGSTGLTLDELGNMKKIVKIRCDVSNACSKVSNTYKDIVVIQAQLGQLSPVYVKAWSEAATAAGVYNPDADLIKTAYAHVNLGDEYVLDPCKYGSELYQWGRKKDGHQRRNLTDTDVWPNGIGTAGNGVANASTDVDANKQVKPDNVRYGKFIKSKNTSHNWLSVNQDNLWGDGVVKPYSKQAYNPVWAFPENNPCPTGWTVPSQKQWGALFAGDTLWHVAGAPVPDEKRANSWTWISGYQTRGYKVADALFLYAIGQRNSETGALFDVGAYGNYWSSTVISRWKYSHGLGISMNTISPGHYVGTYRGTGLSVRCIIDDKPAVPCVPISTVSVSGGTAICQNETTEIVLTAATTGGTATSYQWYKDGVILSGATANTYTVPQTVKNTAGTHVYTVNVANACSDLTSATANVTVNAIPDEPTVTTPVAAYANTDFTLSGSAPTGVTIDWFTVSSGGTAIGRGVSYTVTGGRPVGKYTYYAQARNATTGCVSVSRKAVTVNVIALTDAPVVTTPVAACANTSFTLDGAVPTGCTIDWYTVPTGGMLVGTGTSYAVTAGRPVGTHTFYAESRNTTTSAISATRTPVTVNVTALPAAPTVISQVIPCADTDFVLSGTPPAGCTIDWFTVSSGGTAIGTGTSHTVSGGRAAGIYTYYAESRNTTTGCTSISRKAVTVDVVAVPAAPTVTTPVTTCVNADFTLEGTAPTGCTIDWYITSSGGIPIGSGTSYTVSGGRAAAGNYIFYAESRNTTTGCVSATRIRLLVSVKAVPAAPTVTTPVAACANTSFTLKGTAPTGCTIDWYTVSTGGTSVGTGTSYTVTGGRAAGTHTYYAESRNTTTGCISTTRKAVTVNVTAVPAAPTVTTPVAACANVSFTLKGTAPANCVVDWYTASTGGTLVGTGTSCTVSGGRTAGTYTYYAESRNTTTGCVSATRKAVTVNVNAVPAAPTVTTPVAACTNTSFTLKGTAPTGSTIDWYTASTGGTLVGTGTSYTVSGGRAAGTYTYYAQSRNTTTGCISTTRKAVKVNVTAPITALYVEGCIRHMYQYQTMKIEAIPRGGTAASYKWLMSVDGGTTYTTISGQTSNIYSYTPSISSWTTDALGNKYKNVKFKCEVTSTCGNVKASDNIFDLVVVNVSRVDSNSDGTYDLQPVYANAWNAAGTALIKVAYAHVNIGAENELNPCEALGDVYQWGRRKDGHQKRVLTDSQVYPAGLGVRNGTISSPAQNSEVSSTTGQVLSSSVKYGKFIKSIYPELPLDWRATRKDDLWGDGVGASSFANMTYNQTWKIPGNNPCPTGWKVPSIKQLSALFRGGDTSGVITSATANTWTHLDFPWGNYGQARLIDGVKVGNALFFPSAGARYSQSGDKVYDGYDIKYWSANGWKSAALGLHFQESSKEVQVGTAAFFNRGNGHSVRCIKE